MNPTLRIKAYDDQAKFDRLVAEGIAVNVERHPMLRAIEGEYRLPAASTPTEAEVLATAERLRYNGTGDCPIARAYGSRRLASHDYTAILNGMNVYRSVYLPSRAKSNSVMSVTKWLKTNGYVDAHISLVSDCLHQTRIAMGAADKDDSTIFLTCDLRDVAACCASTHFASCFSGHNKHIFEDYTKHGTGMGMAYIPDKDGNVLARCWLIVVKEVNGPKEYLCYSVVTGSALWAQKLVSRLGRLPIGLLQGNTADQYLITQPTSHPITNVTAVGLANTWYGDQVPGQFQRMNASSAFALVTPELDLDALASLRVGGDGHKASILLKAA